MLFQDIQRVTRIVSDHERQAWDSPIQCEKYVSRLMSAVEELSARNRKLRGVHFQLSSGIVELTGIDLLRQRDSWNDQLKKLQAIFTREERVTDADSMLVWRKHWDHQLYKAFEYQYRLCLESVNDNLFDIPVDLFFSRKRLNLRPPLEDLRAQYYRNLKKFLDLPKVFVGFNEGLTGETIYSFIPERNSQGLNMVYQNAEVLFDKLRDLCESHEHWVALGTVDIEEYVDTHLEEVKDYNRNFEILEEKRYLASKLPSSVKIGCFTVSFVPFKSALDDLMHRFSDALLLSLRKKAVLGLKTVEEFLNDAMQMLTDKPDSVHDLTKAKSAWKDFARKKKEMMLLTKKVYQKNTCLRQKGSLYLDLSGLKPRWETFVSSMTSFDDVLEGQRESLKGGVEKRIKKLSLAIQKFTSRWRRAKPETDAKQMTQAVADKILSEISDWKEELAHLSDMATTLVKDIEHFEMPKPDFSILEDTKKEIEQHASGWSLYDEYNNGLSVMTSEAWVAFRAKIFTFEDFLVAWVKKLKGRPKDIVYEYIVKELKAHKQVWPILQKVTGELFEAEHWKLMFAKLKFPADVTLATVTMGHFLEAKDIMMSEQKFLDNLAARARGEVAIRDAVEELRIWAENTEFSLLEHPTTSGKGTHLIKEWKELFTKLSDQQSLVGSLKESPYYPPFADQASDFENKLVLLDGALHDINQIQRKWVYLEPIFGRGALPQEAARFKRIDSEFRAIMDDIHENPNVMALASYTSLKETVKVLLDQLERCQKALNDFLEEKRSKFPRFYFIGDDDLLEILGQSQNPAVIQNHLKKLFAGIHAVEFSEDKKNIVAMKSSKGEVVAMHFPVKVTEKVEEWLQELSDCMKVTLAKLTASCASEQALNYKKYPSQVLCLSEMVSFTVNTERAITSGKLSKWHAALKDKLEELTSMDTKTSKLLRLKVQALVMDLIHNIDVVKLLLENNVSTLHNWLWQKQLRFYFNEKQYVQAVMTDATFDYTYEYQGNAGKLVHTPLTDKCYLVLTQGMHLGYGGNPYGPAGTGKTESVKALGAALGRQVLVFNCDEGIDFQSMGRIFMGLVKSGAWGCFDEFNRLKEDQLSAVSQQIQVIQAAIKAGDPECELLNHTIEVNRNAGIFVTMNPASKEYGGRSKLPHNLKQLFRAVAMSVPDNALIAETILYSQGFKYAHDVGHKLVQVYMLSRQLLTPQKHYDWGLRALKTILSHGGQLIQKEKQAGTEITLQLESKLIIGSLKINTLSKLTYDDSIRFNALINDVFPGIEDDEIDYKDLEAAIRSALDELELEQVDSQIKKILQLNEALQQRMGVVVVGPSGCGKTVMLNVLHLALKKLGQSVVRHVMNPKALEREKLLGHMDHDTREWFDGVLTASARQVMKESHDTHSWVICDGDIDPEWVESLNSVLDDNRLLTMPNGERIAFGSNVNFVFETHDLQFASPATISRMGMIFLSEENTDIRSLVTAWIRKQPQDMHGSFTKWMDKLFYKALEWNMESGEFVVASTKVGLVSTALTHLSGVTCKGEFVCGLIRGMGSNLPINKRVALAQEVFEWAGERPPERHAPLDCFWNPKVKAYQQYVHQDTAIDSQTLSVQNPPMIHTVDIQRNMAMIKPWLTKQQPFILVGPEGCGKTLLLTNMFKDLKATSVVTIHCSAQTQSKHVIQKLDEGCASFSTKTGRVLRPKEGERLILFLKDLNLPKPDIYDTIQMIAFLQQLVTYQGFHDDNLDWVGIENVQIVASMNPATTVGRSELSTRFTAIVNVAFMNYPDQDQLQIVYASYLRSVLSLSGKLHDNSWRQDSNIHRLTSAMMGVYEKLKRTFSADDHRHYLFNPRDVTQWVFGLLRYDLATQDLLEVWTYEANRLFCDRLVNRDATNKFENIIADLLRSQFKTEIKLTTLYYTTLQEPQIESKEEKQDDSSSSSSSAASEVGPLLERVSNKEFKQIVSEFLHNYERENKNLRMLLFPEILDHIAYEDRVLSRPGGSLLLVGDSGVGRRTATQLVCFIHRMTFCSPNITLSYDQKSFRSELKDLLKLAGVENKKVCLYIEDHQIVYEGMLEDVNSLLSAGQVPGMYMPNELEPLLTPIKEEWSKDGRYRNPWNFFVHRIRTNLRIVLGFDPRNPKFGIRCESNPAIYTQCTIIWMGRWSKHGMLQVPVMRLKEIMGKNPRKLIEQIFIVHGSMLQRGATPLKYVAFLDTYLKLYKHHQTKLQTQQQHLAGGLQKLQEAGAMVDTLSKEASEKKELVIQKQKEADEGLERITESMQQASERRTETETLQKVLAVEEKNLSVRQGQIAEELKEVEPVLEKARNDVNGIRKDNLSEIRAFRMPPPAIHHVLAGVLTLLKIQDLSWENMRKFVGSSSLKSDIINFDAATVDKETRQKVTALIKKNPSSFEQETIKKANVAAAPLASWVKANLKCAEVLAEIAPLRAEFAAANAKLTDARTRLTACEQELAKLDKDVVDLKESFSKTTSEAEELKDQLKKTTEILTAAQSLLGKLSGEQERWQEQVGVLTTSLETLSSQALIAAGFTTYLAGYAEDIRRRKLGEWLKKFEMTKFDYMNFMSSESEFLKWKAEGLPSDTLSMQNGLVVEHTVQTPFIIDPNMAAAEWLKTHLEGAQNKSVEAVIMQDPRFVTTLELAVRFGKTLIIQEVDGVHPILYPLIRRDLCRQGPRMIVMVGDKAIDYNDGFRLYLVTRDPAPDISSDAKAMITEINFTVTRSGLEGQLLGMVLNHEKPELEKEKSALLAKEDALKIQLADLEKSLLQELAASEGNILENKALIVSLDQTKEQSTNINEALQNSKTVQKDLDKQRNVYRPIAKAGSITYFLIAQLSAVNNMYQFSLPMFNRLFQQNLQRETDGQTEARIKSLIRSLTLSIFHYVTRSIFKADRSMFALHLIHCLHPEQFQRNEWEYLTGELVVDVGGDDDYSNSRSRLPRWATSDRAGPFDSFCSTFPELSRQLQVDKEDIWDGWARSGQCENNFPSSLSHLTPFQQLLCVHVFRPDRLQSAIVSYACKALGVSSLAPTPLNFESIWEQSSPDQPIMFITSAGADPTQELEDFAVKKVGKHNFSQLAMGSGQTDAAVELLREAVKEGKWLCLKNLHLVTGWLQKLEKLLKGIEYHQEFRLWLTTEPHTNFPNILLQQSLKITYESPPGVKQNLLRTYESWEPEYISKGSVTRAQTLFCLAWFHAIVQERRTYIPQGFTKFYEFSFADLRSGADIIDAIYTRLNPNKSSSVSPDKLPWTTIWGLMEFAIYGGRIDNDHDVRVLVTYLKKYFSTAILGGKKRLFDAFDMPNSNNHADYKQLILSLSDTDMPSVFCLPANIEGAVQQSQATYVLSQLRKLAVSSAMSKKFNREQWRSSVKFHVSNAYYHDDLTYPRILLHLLDSPEFLFNSRAYSFTYLPSTLRAAVPLASVVGEADQREQQKLVRSPFQAFQGQRLSDT